MRGSQRGWNSLEFSFIAVLMVCAMASAFDIFTVLRGRFIVSKSAQLSAKSLATENGSVIDAKKVARSILVNSFPSLTECVSSQQETCYSISALKDKNSSTVLLSVDLPILFLHVVGVGTHEEKVGLFKVESQVIRSNEIYSASSMRVTNNLAD